MSEPAPIDSTAVIMARMEVKLDNALREQERHGSTLDRHDTRLAGVENRLTVIEAQRASDTEHKTNGLTARQTLWFAVSALAAVAAIVVTVLLAHR